MKLNILVWNITLNSNDTELYIYYSQGLYWILQEELDLSVKEMMSGSYYLNLTIAII